MTKKTKQANCTVCGIEFEASVFASLKTCRCDGCKGSKAPKKEAPAEKKLTPLEQAELMAKQLAEEATPAPPIANEEPVVHTMHVPTVMQDMHTPEAGTEDSPNKDAYGDSIKGPRIDGAPNKALARMSCPHHSHQPMKIIGVIKSTWGDMVDLQCQTCFTRVQITDRPKNGYAVQTTGCGTSFEPAEILESLDNGNIADKLK